MKEKVELILNELIKVYLESQKPISSTFLKKRANLNISPSTIRGYFQSLEKMGMIKKEHISSGSYPSSKAMEIFWKRYLPKEIDKIALNKLEKNAKKFGITIFVKIFDNQMLKNIYNVNNKFIILEFENDEIAIKYDKNIFKLLESLKFLHLKDILKILNRYKLTFLIKKIENFEKNYIINKNLLYNKFSKLNPDDLNQIDDYYINNNENIFIKRYSIFDEDKEIDIFLVGDLYSNFLGFVESVKGGENE